MINRHQAGLFLASCMATTMAFADDRSPAPQGAEVYVISPADGAAIHGPVTVRFGLRGMGVAPAGVTVPDTGHHHLLINAPLPTNLNLPLPSSDQVRHFGKGQTETTLDLAAGRYTLQLVLGNHLHVPHDPPLISKPIAISVVPLPKTEQITK